MNKSYYSLYIIGTDVVAVTLSTVAVINAVPVVVPEVNVVVAAPEAPVVNVANVKVPNVVVNVTVASRYRNIIHRKYFYFYCCLANFIILNSGTPK